MFARLPMATAVRFLRQAAREGAYIACANGYAFVSDRSAIFPTWLAVARLAGYPLPPHGATIAVRNDGVEQVASTIIPMAYGALSAQRVPLRLVGSERGWAVFTDGERRVLVGEGYLDLLGKPYPEPYDFFLATVDGRDAVLVITKGGALAAVLGAWVRPEVCHA